MPDPVTRDGSLLVLCVAIALPGCLFAEPPERQRQRTPVFFDLSAADPPITKILRFGTLDPEYKFSVPIASEDNGEPVRWALHRNLNLNLGTIDVPRRGSLSASTITDEDRQIAFSYGPRASDESCFQITLMACHESSYLDSLNGEPVDRCNVPDDTALATWWINFGEEGSANFEDCPESGQTTTP